MTDKMSEETSKAEAVSRMLADDPTMSRDYAVGWVEGRWSGDYILIAKNVSLKKLVGEAIELLEADTSHISDGVTITAEIRPTELWLALAKIEMEKG